MLTGGLGIVFFAGILYLTLRAYRDDSSLIQLIAFVMGARGGLQSLELVAGGA